MKFSQTFIPTLKEAPAEATLKSHILMIRAGMIRKLGSGLYTYLPYGLAILKKVEDIVRNEMNAQGAIEIVMPLLVPRTLLDQSGRWEVFKSELFRLRDRNETDFAMSPTNEESVTQLIAEEISSYRQLPINLYHINYKFRDEIRPRYGVIRSKEFIMKDAYSFDMDEAGLDVSYQKMSVAYHRIFKHCGLDFVNVKADSGTMGGNASEEFMVKSAVGEEFIIHCSCGYTSNIEAAEEKISYSQSNNNSGKKPIEKIATPEVHTIAKLAEFLDIPVTQTIKTMVYEMKVADKSWKPFVAIIRGDYEINDTKLNKWVTTQGGIELRSAGVKIITNIFGPKSKPGSLGIKNLAMNVPIVVDLSLKGIEDSSMGANEEGFHFIHVNVAEELKVYSGNLIHYQEIYTAKENGICTECGNPLQLFKGIEVGHIFKLGKKYTESFNIKIPNQQGENIIPTMGCYGIGVTRIIAAVIEQMSDERGIILPYSLAPYKVVILSLNTKDEKVMEISCALYESLKAVGLAPLWDEREERAGFKFKDAELLGIPIQIVVGEKGVAKGECELRFRSTSAAKNVNIIPEQTVAIDKVVELLTTYHHQQLKAQHSI